MGLTVYQLDLQTQISQADLMLLTSEERATVEKYRQPLLKQRQLAVRIWLRRILANYLTTQPESLRFAKQAFGKPYLIDYPEIAFNLSHSRGLMLLALSDIGDIGIDVELPSLSARNFPTIVNKCFADSEQRYWYDLEESAKIEAFYQFWTRKEAFVKAVGRGLALGLEQCVIATEMPLRFVQLPKAYGKPEQWRLWDIQVSVPGYAALVIQEHPAISSIEHFTVTVLSQFSDI